MKYSLKSFLTKRKTTKCTIQKKIIPLLGIVAAIALFFDLNEKSIFRGQNIIKIINQAKLSVVNVLQSIQKMFWADYIQSR